MDEKESKAVRNVYRALRKYNEQCLTLLVLADVGAGKTTFCEGLFKQCQPADDFERELTSAWALDHKVGPSTEYPGCTLVELANLTGASKSRRLLLLDIPGEWFLEPDRKKQRFVATTCASADV